MEIKNLKKAANRILRAIKKKERIIIYGDSDLDGVASVVILKECIKNLNGKITEVFFPDREKEGYGINTPALFYLKKYSPALLLVLDLGIGNFKEVEMAKKMGFEIIIIDHHEILEKLPKADIVVNPKQRGDKYPFKQFATVGIVFKLAEILLNNKISKNLRRSFLELAAMATIADMMPRTNDNEEIIQEGLGYLNEDSWRPGIQALMEIEKFKPLTILERVNKVNSLLNIRDIKDDLPVSYRLLTITNKKEAEKLVKKLLKKEIKKRIRIKEIIDEIEKRIFLFEKEPLVFEGDSKWELIFLGVIAAVLAQKYQKPIFLYKKGKTDSLGSVRAPSGFNTVEAMKSCSQFLLTYGGHPAASGFRVKNNNLEKFKSCLINFFKKK